MDADTLVKHHVEAVAALVRPDDPDLVPEALAASSRGWLIT
jgi:hypothetical protein